MHILHLCIFIIFIAPELARDASQRLLCVFKPSIRKMVVRMFQSPGHLGPSENLLQSDDCCHSIIIYGIFRATQPFPYKYS